MDEMVAQDFQILIKELKKKSPSQPEIKRLTKKIGIPYSKDTVMQMKQVLIELNGPIGKTKGFL